MYVVACRLNCTGRVGIRLQAFDCEFARFLECARPANFSRINAGPSGVDGKCR